MLYVNLYLQFPSLTRTSWFFITFPALGKFYPLNTFLTDPIKHFTNFFIIIFTETEPITKVVLEPVRPVVKNDPETVSNKKKQKQKTKKLM